MVIQSQSTFTILLEKTIETIKKIIIYTCTQEKYDFQNIIIALVGPTLMPLISLKYTPYSLARIR